MRASWLVLAAAGMLAAGARAQLVEPPAAPRLQRQPQPQDPLFAKSYQPSSGPYARDESDHPDARLFPDYRTDPKLRSGFDLLC